MNKTTKAPVVMVLPFWRMNRKKKIKKETRYLQIGINNTKRIG